MRKKGPVILLILDGWGYRENPENNAIAKANTPQWDAWWQTQPHGLLQASGPNVGLPEGQMGNSEVGHMHIGAGRLLLQDLTRINAAIDNEEFDKNTKFIHAIEEMKQTNHTIHILGLLSDGGVHSHENHLFAFLRLCYKHQFSNVALHLFLDGRDTSPQSATIYLERLTVFLKKYPVAKIASITGRFYAMDRDKRWNRIEPLYRLLTENKSEHQFNEAQEAIHHHYQQACFDEFIPPTIIGEGIPIKTGDTIFMFNFRADRVRQLTQTFLDPLFHSFNRKITPALAHFISMTSYADNLPTESAFPPVIPHQTLGEVVAAHGLKQLRIAETEKYAHVTFFLNGGIERTFENEERILIQSPLVNTYDLQPEMSAPELTTHLINAIKSQQYDLIICNYANADMVGHTGNLNACVKAIEQLDRSMREIWKALENVQGQMLITADHGNAECMFDPEARQAHTAHTSEPVPLLYIGDQFHFSKNTGTLSDIAPTTLLLLGITPPDEMTGQILLVKK